MSANTRDLARGLVESMTGPDWEEYLTDSDHDGRSRGFQRANGHEISAHVGLRVAADRSFDARGSFVHFAHHSLRDVLPGHDFIEGHTARNFLRNPRSGWYDSEHSATLRKVLRSKAFAMMSMLSIFIALFFSDLFVVLQVPSNWELDLMLTSAFIFFWCELLALAAAEASYPMSFFFLMDLVGTVSLVFDISFMFGPDATMPDRLARGGSNGNVALTRAARTARLGARAGRLSRVAKILRFMNAAPADGEDGQVKMSKIISNKLSDVLSIRVAFLTICVSLVLPSMRMFEYPDMDESMVAWTNMVAADLQESHNTQATGEAHAAAVAAGERLRKEARRFAHFYTSSTYGPFLACYGSQVEVRHVQAHCGGPPVQELVLDTAFRMPRRGSSILEMSGEGGLHVFFDMSTPQRCEAAMSIGLVIFVIAVMVIVSVTLSSNITVIALTPLERMLSVVRERCEKIFKYTNMFEQMQGDKQAQEEEEEEVDAEEKAYQSEFVLLEKAVAKLAAIVHLSATKTQPEVSADMDESDLMVMNWMQGRQLPVEGRASGFGGGSDNALRVPRRGGTYRFSELIGSAPLNPTSVVLRKVTMEISQALQTTSFDALTVPRELKPLVTAFIVYYSDGNSEYTQSVVPERIMLTFASRAEQNYPANPFHNFAHALDVAYSVSLSFRDIEVDYFMSEDVQLWVLIACIGHDLGHLGVNNQYLIESSHELAVMYNDRSPLENMHCSRLFQILGDPEANVFLASSKEDYKEIRKGIIDAILHTDVTKHNEMVKELNLLYQLNTEAFDSDIEPREMAAEVLRNNGQLVVNALVHCADVGNPMKPWDLCFKLAYLCLDEFFAQGDSEKELGIPVGMLNDREKVNRANSQIGFIEFMLAPYVEAMVSIFPKLGGLSGRLGENLRMWVKTWEEEASPAEEALEKVRFRTSKTAAKLEGIASGQKKGSDTTIDPNQSRLRAQALLSRGRAKNFG